MVHLIDSWKSSAWFALSLIPYVVRQIVGAILMAIALLKAKTVPSWMAVATGAWPLLAVAGQASGVRVIGVIGYALLFVTWAVFAMSLVGDRQATPVVPALATT